MDEIIPQRIEPTPIIKGIKCKILLFCLYAFMTYSPLLLGLFVWYMYSFLVAVAFYLLATLFMGIVISKIRLVSLPVYQREMSYDNMAIARWYLSKSICPN